MLTATLFALLGSATALEAQSRDNPGELAWAIRYDPRTLDPAKVDDQGAETLRYLTAGVLVHIERPTQAARPELAEGWTVSPDGKLVTFHLRRGLLFSDGSPLTARDAAWSIQRVLAPATAAPVAQEFLDPTGVRVETPDALTVRVLLPKRVIGIASVFDEIAIEPATRPSEGRITSGPFTVEAHTPGHSVHLVRNPHYWKRDGNGNPLPYAPGIRLDVLTNREAEIARFERGDYDLIDGLSPDYFGLLQHRDPASVRDLGPSLNTEQMWFNQAPAAPLPDFEKAWFTSQPFRVAVSRAIHRADLARLAYDGHATPAHDFISPVNRAWFNTSLNAPPEDPAAAARLLAEAGFRRQGKTLLDAAGHPVRFSLLTNAGNAARARMAEMIQQDLGALGIEVNVVSLDFPALLERLMHTLNYEACLLGHPNVDPDPNSLMNEWLSSSPNHQWNPSEKTPATPWEAEIDRLMQTQATALDPAQRKRAVDRVQQIVADQQPFIYLVYPNTLDAVSPGLRGVRPTVFQPGLVWNVEFLSRSQTK